MKTDTPRTDEVAWPETGLVEGDFARQLERELTAARAEIERLDTVGIHSCHDNCQRWTCVLRRERDEARAEISHMVSENGNMYLEIFIARNQRDRLAEALRECLERLEHHTEFGALVQADMSAMHSSREALQSLTTTEQ